MTRSSSRILPSSREGLAAFDAALYAACALVRPPEKLSVAEWADKYAFLSAEGSARPGKFYISEAEYQRQPLEVVSPGSGYQRVVLDWPSQVGKTQIGLILTGFHIKHDPAPILFMEPDENLAKTIAKDRIDPMIRDTPVLTPLFGAARSRGSGNDTLHKTFPGGHLTMAWASSSSQTASRPIRILITDEESRPGYDQNPEGDAIGQARARLATFPTNRMHLDISSPALLRTCKITRAYNASDQRQYFVPCPQCGHMQTLRWEQVHWPHGDPNACYYVCEANACEILDADKHQMVRKGEWRAGNPGGGDGRTAGFHINALYSTIGYTWAELVQEFLACEGLPDKLQVFQNTKLALPWDEQAEGADLSEVQKHAEVYPAQAPDWVVIVTCGVDVQKDRIEATKWGWGLREVSGVIEHRVFYGTTDVANSGAWLAFDEWRQLRVDHASGLQLPVACTFIDSGDGNRTQQVYEYTRRHETEGVRACKGSSQNGAALVSDARRTKGGTRALLVMVGTSTAKDTIYARLRIVEKDKPGYIHFPSNDDAGCTQDYFRHLTAEVLVTRRTQRGEVSRWENPNKRNEALDCAVYAYAARVFTRAPLVALAQKLRERAARLTPEQRSAAVARIAAAPLPSPLSASSHPSPSGTHNTQQIRRKSGPKRILRPGGAWIRG